MKSSEKTSIKSGILSKIINIVLDILIFLFGIILLISIYKGVQVKLLGKDYSDFFGYSIFEVQTGSMLPTIDIGDWVIVKEAKYYQVGDIITFKKGENYITHKIVESYRGTFITKGDANNTKDDPITEEQIVGKVRKILPHFGIIKKTIFNPFVLITLIITLFVVNYVFSKNKNEKPNFINKLLDKVIASKKNKKEKVKETKTEVKEIIKEEVKEEIKEEPKKEIKGSKIVKDKDYKEMEEVKFEQVNVPQEEEKVSDISLAEVSEEDLDKTMYFRAIQVDKDEIENTLGKAAANQMIIDEEDKKEEEKALLKKQKEEEARLRKEKANEEVDTSIVDAELDKIKTTSDRKFSNIIDKSMYIKEQELLKIVDILNNKEELENNEASIRNSFIKGYIDVRYYNHCGNYDADYTQKNMTVKIVDAIKDMSEDIIKNYKGKDTDYEDKVMKYTNIFILVMYLEQANGDIKDIDLVKEMFKKKITKYFKNKNVTDENINEMINQIIEVQKLHRAMINRTLKKLETKTFVLQNNQLSTKKNFYCLDLDYNINFSKVYSDYILDKTYNEGIVAEDKVAIIINLFSMQLLEDMLDGNFKKKYFLYVPGSIYEKDNKRSNLIKISDNECIKDNLYIVVNYEDLENNIKVITESKKSGYKFALLYDKEVEKINTTILDVVDYVFVDKKKAGNIIPNIPDDLSKNIITENIEDKIGYSIGGDK